MLQIFIHMIHFTCVYSRSTLYSNRIHLNKFHLRLQHKQSDKNRPKTDFSDFQLEWLKHPILSYAYTNLGLCTISEWNRLMDTIFIVLKHKTLLNINEIFLSFLESARLFFTLLLSVFHGLGPVMCEEL